MKKFILLSLTLAASTSFAGDKVDEKTADAILEIMEDMKKPNKDIKNTFKKKKEIDADFKKNVNTLIELNKKLVAIKHPKKDFNDMSAKLKKDLDMLSLELAAKKLDRASIETLYKAAKANCSDCHDIYQD